MSSLGNSLRGKGVGNKIKTASILILLLCFTGLSLNGCSSVPADAEQEPPASSESEPPAADRINAPVSISYSVNNPLTIEEHTEGDGNQFNYSYITVSGLKDKEIEAALNDRIKAVYDELRVQDLPPYRGIKTKISENASLQNESIYVDITGNFNNILSVMFQKHANYLESKPGATVDEKSYDQYGGSFSEIETLNFDLRTGEEIKLKDLFCDNVDHMELINDNISQFLSKSHADEEGYYIGMYSGIKLVGAFKGISENQRFAVYPNGVAFVFDYRTPQFETGCMAVSAPFDYSQFGNAIAVMERYYTGSKSIFSSDKPLVKALVAKNVISDIGGNESIQDDNVNIYQSWRYSSDLPEEIQTKLDAMRKVDQTKIDKIKERYSTISEEDIRERGPGAYEIMVYGEMIGNYINVTSYSNLYLYDYFEQMIEFHCYDSVTHGELQLEDLFTSGYDYKPVLLAAIKKTVHEYDGMQKDTPDVKYSEQQIEEIFGRINGFNLSVDSVNIPIVHPDKGNQAYGLSVYIPYKDFGCENMTIFR